MKSRCRKHPSLKSCFWLENAQSHCRGRARWCNTRDRKIVVPPQLFPARALFYPLCFHTWGEETPPSVGDAAPHPGHLEVRSTRICGMWLQLCGRGLREGVDGGEGVVSLLLVLCLTLG